MRFVDLFAGLGGFHYALSEEGHHCVFAAEIDPELRKLYRVNFPSYKGPLVGDLRLHADDVPAHDFLCAGFPCQPFSKSGEQLGTADEIRGTLFFDLIQILIKRMPKFVLLENVGNFEKHDQGRSWNIVKRSLSMLGYDVRGTEHIGTGGAGLISPIDIGVPHSRPRFFIAASLNGFDASPFEMSGFRKSTATLREFILPNSSLSSDERKYATLTSNMLATVEIWNRIISQLPCVPEALPSFPLWSDEFGAKYPFVETTPANAPLAALRKSIRSVRGNRAELLACLPPYARRAGAAFPSWKRQFIHSNRRWFKEFGPFIDRKDLRALRKLPWSYRKLEWNVKGGKRDIWEHVLQFRPSGLRVKSATCIPSLVAMTSTQVPIIGISRRHLTTREGLILQGFPQSFVLPGKRTEAFAALGNAVHVEIVRILVRNIVQNAHQEHTLDIVSRPNYEGLHSTLKRELKYLNDSNSD